MVIHKESNLMITLHSEADMRSVHSNRAHSSGHERSQTFVFTALLESEKLNLQSDSPWRSTGERRTFAMSILLKDIAITAQYIRQAEGITNVKLGRLQMYKSHHFYAPNYQLFHR